MVVEIRITVHVGSVVNATYGRDYDSDREGVTTSEPLFEMFLSFSVDLLVSGDANEPSWELRGVRRYFSQETRYTLYSPPLIPDINASI